MMNRKTLRAALIAAVAMAASAAACDDTSDGTGPDVAPTTTPCDRLVDAAGEPVACVTGRLVDVTGAPVEGLKVSACTLHTCIIGDSRADGTYRIGGIPTEPHKVEILGQLRGYATMIFYQETIPGVFTTPPADIVMVPLADPPTAWPTDVGGTVVLADGALELTAAPDTLRYPLGTVDKEVIAVEVDADHLAPYDLTPWIGREAGTRAFYVNPFPIHASEPVGLVVHGAEGVAAGARYAVYQADHLEALLEHVGDAVADGEGRIVLEEGANLTMLTTIILVPEA